MNADKRESEKILIKESRRQKEAGPIIFGSFLICAYLRSSAANFCFRALSSAIIRALHEQAGARASLQTIKYRPIE